MRVGYPSWAWTWLPPPRQVVSSLPDVHLLAQFFGAPDIDQERPRMVCIHLVSLSGECAQCVAEYGGATVRIVKL